MCPQCGSDDVLVEPYETEDRSTGYRDYGVLVTCRACGSVSTEEEIVAEALKQ